MIKSSNSLIVIKFTSFIILAMSASLASMLESIFVTLHTFQTGLHESVAIGYSVARIFIDVFGPQALGTVIGISIAYYMVTTFLTCEVFFDSYKCLAHVYQ